MVLSNRDDWEVNRTWLESQAREGRESIKAALDELRELGYVAFTRMRYTDTKRFSHSIWCFYDTDGHQGDPCNEKPSDGFPSEGKPSTSEELSSERQSNQKQNCPVTPALRGSHRTICDASRVNGKSHHTKTNGVNKVTIQDNTSSSMKKEPPSPRIENGFNLAKETVPPFIREACLALENYVRQKSRLDRRYNRTLWQKEMIGLLRELRGDKARMLSVLDRYMKTEGEYKHQVESAASFRTKFAKIEDWLIEQNNGDTYVPPGCSSRVVERQFVKNGVCRDCGIKVEKDSSICETCMVKPD